jgi:tetratricopeptide (TPR) repeat protein
MIHNHPIIYLPSPRKWAVLAVTGFMALCMLCAQPVLAAEKVKAVLAIPQGGGEFQYVTLQKIKLNGKSEVRNAIFTKPLTGADSSLAKDEYKDLQKIRLESLTKLELVQGVPYAYAGTSNRFAVLPDNHDFGKAKVARVSQVTAALLEGEGRDETPKRKQAFRLADIRRIYIVAENTPLEDVAYRNAQDESAIETWRAFFKSFPNSRNVPAARNQFHSQLLALARAELDRFHTGSYSALGKSNQILAEAEKVLPRNDLTATLRAEVDNAEAKLQSTITTARSLLDAKDADAALGALEPFEKYRKEVPELAEVHQKALVVSNQFHRDKAEALRKSDQYEEALKELEIAFNRLPSPETKGELNEVKILIGLRDTNRFMAGKKYREALEIVTPLVQTFPADVRVQDLSGKVRTARSKEIHDGLKPLVNDPKIKLIATRESEKTHLNALKYLEEAESLAATPQLSQDLQKVRRRLADYYVSLAQKSQARPRGAGVAAGYLYLARAQALDSGRSGLADLVHQSRESFQRKGTMPIAVRVRNSPRAADPNNWSDHIEASVSSALVNAGIPGISVVERGLIGSASNDDEMLRRLSQGERAAALVLADVIVNQVQARDQTFQRQSQFLANEWENPKWREYENQSDYWDSQWDACRKQLGNDNATCQGYRQQKEYYKNLRNSVPQNLQDIRPYTFVERQVSMEATVKVSYRFVDSLTATRMAEQYLEDGDRSGGTEVSGVHAADMRGFRESRLNLPSQSQFVANVRERVQGQLVSRTLEYCRGLPAKYYGQAESAASRGSDDEALEYYALFLYSTSNKDSIEAGKARSFLAEKFKLEFDGKLR